MTDTSTDWVVHTAEQALIGAALTHPAAAAQLTEQLTPNIFNHPQHEVIWTHIRTRIHNKQNVSEILVAADLANANQLHKLPEGGASYLHTCTQAAAATPALHEYVNLVTQAAAARTAQTAYTRLGQALALSDTTRRAQLASEALNTLVGALEPTSANGAKPTNPLRLTPAAQFTIRAVKWLWQGRMPVGEITLIPGREGVGKSIFLAWLAAAITNGNLPGIHHGTPKAVLYAASEDSWEYTIAPRMLAAGANLDLVYRVDVETPDGFDGLTLPRDCHHLPGTAAQVDAAALMCDPIVSLVDEAINSYRAPELRKALEPLRRYAEAAGLAVPALVHFNKNSDGDVATKIAGSRAWVEVARAVIAIVEDNEADDYTCVVDQRKNNLGRLDLANLTYTIDSVVLEASDGEDAHVGRLRWTGETDTTADELLNTKDGQRPLSDTSLAILDYVEDMKSVTVQDVTNHFKDTVRYETVKKTLARLARRGQLVSPSRGLYATPKTAKTLRGRQMVPRTPTINPGSVPNQPSVPIPAQHTLTHTESVPMRDSGDKPGTGQGHQGPKGHQGRDTRAHTHTENVPPTPETPTKHRCPKCTEFYDRAEHHTCPGTDPWGRARCPNGCGGLLNPDDDPTKPCRFCQSTQT